jgi:deazaflavin-dependent oxidoreductase (nitroreductase family)
MKPRKLVAIAALALSAAAVAAGTAEDLRAIESRSTVELTTTGRKSGKPRKATIWFVHEGGRIYLQSGQGGKTDWYRNLTKNPEVTLDFGELRFRGRAKVVDDPKEEERVRKLFPQKYWMAWAGSWFGSRFGSGRVVVVDGLEKTD